MIAGFPRDALFLIAGPCVLEDDNLNLRVGDALARLADVVHPCDLSVGLDDAVLHVHLPTLRDGDMARCRMRRPVMVSSSLA